MGTDNAPGNGQRHNHETILALAKSMKCNAKTLIAMTPQADPFYTGQRAHRRLAEWFANIWQRFNFGEGTHLRRIHYRTAVEKPSIARSGGSPYENTVECWNELGLAGTYARHLGLVPPEDFIDRRNPAARVNVSYGSLESREPGWDMVDFPPWTMPVIFMPPTDGEFSVPSPSVYGYGCSQDDQPFHVEVWIEKTTMNDVLVPLCQELRANFVPAIGQQSITSAIALLRRIPAGKPARVFYLSDFDPTGEDMPLSVSRHLEFYRPLYAPTSEIKLTPLLLTASQVQKYDLPRKPIKEADRRKARFEGRHGEGATELDALEALRPGELRRVVQQAVEVYRDRDIARELREAEGEALDEAVATWENATVEERKALQDIERQRHQIAERFRSRARALNAEMQEKLKQLRERLEKVRHGLLAKVDQLAVDLPLRPESPLETPDEADWLFDSGRDYLDQLEHY